MTTAKTLRELRASQEIEDPMGARRRTGRVSFRAFADWTTRGDLITASLSPRQARRLAIELLSAAEQAEDRSLG